MLGQNDPGTIAGRFNGPAAGSAVYGGPIPQQVYVTPNQVTIWSQIESTGPIGLVASAATAVGEASDAVVSGIESAGAGLLGGIEGLGQWALIALGLVAAIVIVPRVMSKK